MGRLLLRQFCVGLTLWITASSVAAETTVEPKAAVPNIYIHLPEELVRLRDPVLAAKLETCFVWKTGLPVKLEFTVAGRTGNVVCDAPYDKWPAILSEASAKWATAKPPAIETGGCPPITAGKTDFWSLLQRLETKPSTDQEAKLSAADAMNLADHVLMLAVETGMLNLDPNAYRLAARAMALARYAEEVDTSLTPAAVVRVAVALRIQGESGLALTLAKAPVTDMASKAWAAYAGQLPSELAKLQAEPKSEWMEKLRVLALLANERLVDEEWPRFYRLNPEDLTAFTRMVGDGAIVLARSHDGALFDTYRKSEPRFLAAWAKRADPSFKASFQPLVFVTPMGTELDFKSQLKVLYEGVDAMLGQIPTVTPPVSWTIGSAELKELVRGRREALIWQKLRLYVHTWGVSESLAMASAWCLQSPTKHLAIGALKHAENNYAERSMNTPIPVIGKTCRTLAYRALSQIWHPGWASVFPLAEWAEEQPAEIELSIVRAVMAPSCCAQESVALGPLLLRHPLAPAWFHPKQLYPGSRSAVREAALNAMLTTCDLAPEWPEILKTTANTIFDYKRDLDKCLELWERHRRIAPDEDQGYTAAASLLLMREQPAEAIRVLEQATGKVVEAEAVARLAGCRAQCLLATGQTNEAVRLAGEAARVYSHAALGNFADVLFKAGKPAEALKAIVAQSERYHTVCTEGRYLGLNEAGSYRQTVYQAARQGVVDWAGCLQLLEELDKTRLLEEAPADLVPETRQHFRTAPFVSALLRKEQKWEAAVKLLDAVEKGCGNGNFFNPVRYLQHIERERVTNQKTRLDCLKEEGFLTEGRFIGPFKNWFGEGYGTVYPPETEFDPQKTYNGIGGIVCRWRDWKAGGINPFWMSGASLKDILPMWCVYYVRFTVDSPNEGTRQLWFGSEAIGTGVFVNGRNLIPASAFKRDGTLDIALQKGENAILFKVCAGGGHTGAVAARLK